ncbi:MAG: hypothetical protein V1779_04820 [bacterium]
MKLKLLCYLSIIIISTLNLSAKYDVIFTSGIFGGTPFWNSENFSEDYAMNPSLKFLRWYNNISANATFGEFSLHFSGSRSDGFDIRDDIEGSSKYQVHFFDSKYHFTDTRLFRAYVQYKFEGGNVRTGRIPTFNRWLFGSVDGAQVSYDITKYLSASAFGGKSVKYGQLYDSDNHNSGNEDKSCVSCHAVGYGELSYKIKGFGAKAKYMYVNESSKAGVDLYGSLYGVKISANVGYDLTNSKLFDGSLGLYGYIGKKLSLSANISRFTPYLFFQNFYSPLSGEKITPIEPDVTDRILVGASYKLFDNYTLSFRQMVSMRAENLDYLSYLYISHKYFYIGLNYLGGVTKHDTLNPLTNEYVPAENTENSRLGISIGGNYSPFKGFRIDAGIASVDYMMDGEDVESINSIASYLRFGWDIIEDLTLNTNLNYYHNNKAFDQKIRGGLTLQYRIKSGDSK